MGKRGAAVLVVLVLAAAAAAVAAASSVTTITGTVTGGAALSVTPNGTPGFSLTLTGTDQVAAYTLPVETIDPRGTGAGWNLTVTSTQFKDSAGHRFATNASTVASASSGCGPSSTCTPAANSVAYTGLVLPAGITPPPAVKFFNAGAASGLGKVDVNAAVSVAVPANAYAGTYTSTVTVSIVAGP
jgi:putative surface cell wall-binding protein